MRCCVLEKNDTYSGLSAQQTERIQKGGMDKRLNLGVYLIIKFFKLKPKLKKEKEVEEGQKRLKSYFQEYSIKRKIPQKPFP